MDHATAALQESLGNSVYTVAESNVKGKVVAVFGCGPTGEQVGGGTGLTRCSVLLTSEPALRLECHCSGSCHGCPSSHCSRRKRLALGAGCKGDCGRGGQRLPHCNNKQPDNRLPLAPTYTHCRWVPLPSLIAMQRMLSRLSRCANDGIHTHTHALTHPRRGGC